MLGPALAIALLLGATPTRPAAPRMVPNTKRDASALRLLRGNAGVSQSVAKFCEHFSSELTGNYFCLNGDGAQVSAPATTLSAVGAPATVSQRACPNGANCGAVTSQRLGSASNGQRFETPSVAQPAGSWSTCALWRADAITASQVLVSQDNGAGTRIWTHRLSGGLMQATVHGASGNTIGSLAPVAGAWHFTCATFQRVGTGGVNPLRLYVDGSSQAGPVNVDLITGSAPISVGELSGAGSQRLVGNVAAAFFTEKLLDAATISQMASALIPTVTGSRGEAVTYSRASAATCPADDGSVSVLPSGRPCINGSGLLSEPAATNLLTDSEQVTAYAGTFGEGGAAAPTLTADVAVSPSGTMTADRIQTATVTNAGESSMFSFRAYAATSGTTYTHTLHVLGNGTAGTVPFGDWNAGSGAKCTTTLCIYAATGWTRCKHTYTADETTNHRPFIGFSKNRCNTTGSADVFVWGVQAETGSVATSYIPTAGTTATRAATTVTVAKPAAMSLTEGCARVCFTPNWSSAAPGASYYLSLNAAATARIAYSSTSSDSAHVYDGTNQIAVAGSFLANSRKCYASDWSAAQNKMRVTNLTTGAVTTSAAFTGFPSFGTDLLIGHASGGSSQPNGYLQDIALGTSFGGCQ